jgi:hypothetical protein
VNCTSIQRRLLSTEQPDQPPAEIKSHLAQCPACRACQLRLVQTERQIRELPVPPSTAKEELLQRILAGTRRGRVADPSHLWRSALASGPKERGLRKMSVALALAASLLVFALTWWNWPREPSPVVNREKSDQAGMDDRLLEGRLAKVLRGDTPKERVLKLADLAEDVQSEAGRLTDNSERLERWAQFYARLVGTHLVEEARHLPAAERAAVLPRVTGSLIDTESNASRLAAQLKAASPRSATSFSRIALASRKGEQELRALMKG